jgi:hypothetical protein
MAKLLARGAGWLESYPEREVITYRFLKYAPSLARQALAQLEQQDEPGNLVRLNGRSWLWPGGGTRMVRGNGLSALSLNHDQNTRRQ